MPFKDSLTARLFPFWPSLSDVANYLESNPPRYAKFFQYVYLLC